MMLEAQTEARTWFLEEISSLPLPLEQELYRNYPGMKLGQMHLIEFFSERLALTAASILGDDLHRVENEANGEAGWAITAPAFYYLPSAANLLARRVHQLLRERGFAATLIEPRLNLEQNAISDPAELKPANEYSNSKQEKRMTERKRMDDMAQQDAIMPRFKNHRVIIVNDIHVTGAQQHFMQRALTAAGVLACHWLYIFRVERQLALQHPEVEFMLNHSTLADLDSFAAVLADGRTMHTTRCLSRLFGESMENFRYLVSKLPATARRSIHMLVQQEARYDGQAFSDKMLLLAS